MSVEAGVAYALGAGDGPNEQIDEVLMTIPQPLLRTGRPRSSTACTSPGAS